MVELLWLVLVAFAVSTAIKLWAVAKWKRMSEEDRARLAGELVDPHERWKPWRR